MKKTLLPLVFCFLWLGAKAQNCEPSFDCNTAPILCGADLNGLQASTVFNSPTYTIPPGFGFICQNSVIDNNQWIGFSPCTPNVMLLIQVNGCILGNGLQAVIFQTDDCQNFVAYSNCLPEIAPFSTGVLTANNLVPGNVYYLMIDGFSGDVCDYEVSVLSGIDTNVPVFGAEMPGFVDGPAAVGCGTPNGYTAAYAVTPPMCENTGGSSCPGGSTITPDDFCYFYNWTLPQGAVIIDHSANFDEVEIDFSNAVSGLITVTAEFDDQCDCHCGYCPTTLGILPFFVQVNQPTVQVLPPLTLCEGDTFFFCGQTYQLGANGTTFQCANGCDVQMQEVFVEPCNCPQYNLPIAPADSCQTAPSFCASYLNGYCSSNLGFSPDIPGNLASVIPCAIENNQWLKFVACEKEAQLEFGVSNCLAATGLEFFVLQTTDCQIFVTQSACFEVADGATDTLTVAGLTPGETYYLMVDGIGGDRCGWQILSTVGISDGATYQAENTPGQVTGPTSVCAGGSASFTFTSPICDLIPVGGCPAAFQQVCAPQLDTCFANIQYDTIWHVTPAGTVFVNNDSTGLTITVAFPDTLPVPPSGYLEFTISVELVPIPADTLACCPAECLQIIPDTEPCAILPLVVRVCAPDAQTEFFVVCPGQCVDFMGQTFCSPGTFSVTQQDECGCTDLYTVVIDWIIEPPTTVSPPSFACAPDGTTYTVSFEVVSFGNFVLVDGQPFFGTTYTSAPIPSGQPYNILVTSIGSCGTSFSIPVSGSYTCPPCIGGTNDLGTITLCPGECYPLLGSSFCNPGSYSELLYDPVLDCYETYIFTLAQIVEATLATGPVAEFCEATNLYYSVGFSIESGTSPFLVNGNPVTGNFYQSGLIPTGEPYAFTVTDAATCNPQEINIGGIFTCPCVNSPGTVELAVIHQCEGEMAAVGFNNDAVVGPNDLLVFILHTNGGSTLGTVIGINATGSFGYEPGLMNFGQTYYISPAVGPDMGGTVDMSSGCFTISPGQPVVYFSKPVVEILEPDTLTCSLNSLTINSLPSGGSGDFSFGWIGPSNFNSTEANPVVGVAGTYLLTLSDNLTGCQAQSATAVASDTALPVFTVTSSEINCQQPNAILEAASQMPGVTYTWTFPTGDVLAGATISTNIPGDYVVTALGTNGCTAAATTFVTDNGVPPSISAIGGTINCAQPTVQLVASSNEPSATFTWTLPDSSFSAGASLSTSMLGSYTVIVSAPNGCTAEATAAVVEGPDPDLMTDVELMPPTCFGYSDGSIKVLGTMGGTAPYEYTLNDTLAGDYFQNLSAGDYLLTTTDANGCTGEDVVQLIEPQEVMVQIGDDQFIQLGQSVTLTMQASITPDSVVWLGPNGRVWPDVNSLTISPTESGRYTIVISDVNSCRSSDTTYIYVNGEGKVFVPNVFSPNGDGNNDRMMIFAGGDVEQILEFQIFDRWGELVFQDKNFDPNDPIHGWDGHHKGKPMDPAVFVVKAMVEFKDGTKQLVMGDVVLLR